MIYDYKCDECSNSWERECSMDERNDKHNCPSCSAEGKRIISPVRFWYNRTHPDVKQPMEELVAGVPASNMTEL